jgi:uroporphyrinogen-III synthase
MKPTVVLVIRRDDVFSASLRSVGFEVLNLELIKTSPAVDLSGLQNAVAAIGSYDGLFFTSPVAAEVFVQQAELAGVRFEGKIYVLGERAKAVFENVGYDVVYQKRANTAEEMIESFGEEEFAGKRLLFVRGDKSLRVIPNMLAGKATVDEIVVYETNDIRPDDETVKTIGRRLSGGEIEWICFFSPSGVQSFRKLFAPETFATVRIAAIGETTAREAANSGLNLGFVSRHASGADFAEGLIGHINDIE